MEQKLGAAEGELLKMGRRLVRCFPGWLLGLALASGDAVPTNPQSNVYNQVPGEFGGLDPVVVREDAQSLPTQSWGCDANALCLVCAYVQTSIECQTDWSDPAVAHLPGATSANGSGDKTTGKKGKKVGNA